MSISHEYLENIWSSIELNDHTDYDYKRIDAECKPELCLGLNLDGCRCLILELPSAHSIDFHPVIRKNLTLTIHNKSVIILELKTSSFNELFNDLVISLYQNIKDLSNFEEYTSLFIKTFHKWNEFFNQQEFDRLSDDSVKGMFGELIVLSRFISDCSSLEINMFLKAWKGPYDKGKDFELDDKDIEVKTKNLTKLSIKISSEYQLEATLGKDLELWVVSIQSDFNKGSTLSDLVFEIQEIIIKKFGDLSIFRKALWQKGLTTDNLSDYDHLKFIPKSLTSYNTLVHGFPLLNSSNLNVAISKVKYELNLTHIDDYLIDEISL